MIKTMTLTTAVVMALATPALADRGNTAEARAMAAALKTGINQDAGTKSAVEGLGFECPNGKAAVPACVSGGGNGGWGNIGSTLTGPAGSVSGR